jgi:pseudoazurin
MKFYKLFTALVFTLSYSFLVAQQHEVKMLNSGTEGLMVFEPAVLSINPGDSVVFKATDMSHNSASIAGMIPDGAESWSGVMNQDIEINFTKEGVYVYQCTPHSMMAMVGVIRVGAASNLESIKQKAEIKKQTFVMNKERLTTYLSNL